MAFSSNASAETCGDWNYNFADENGASLNTDIFTINQNKISVYTDDLSYAN